MKKIIKPTVTIGIPAHNEEANIANLLKSILEQSRTNFELKAVIVVCDGCSDKTGEIVSDIAQKNNLVKLINDNKRLGKPARLNQLYKLVDSDILVTLDADVILANNDVIFELVDAFNDKNVGLVGGRDVPTKPTGFFEKMVSVGSLIWYEVRKDVNNGDFIYNHVGRISALRKMAYKKITIPGNMAADDVFLYIQNKELGFDFRFAYKAMVYYKEPTSLRDYLIQDSRYKSYKTIILNYFGETAIKHFHKTNFYKHKAIIKYLHKEPLYAPLAIVLKLIALRQWFKINYKGSHWVASKTTKFISDNSKLQETINDNEFISKIIKNKSQCYFISPHLDDAAYSAGGLILHLTKHNVPVKLITIFTKAHEPSTLSAKKFLKDCGYTKAEALYADRVKENNDFANKVSATIVNLGFTDALWRKKTNPNMLEKAIGVIIPEVLHVYPTYRLHIKNSFLTNNDYEKSLVDEISKSINKSIGNAKNCVLFSPLALGQHVDHRVAREVIKKLELPIVYWSDFPYSINYNDQEEFIKANSLKKFVFADFEAIKKERLIKIYKTQFKAMFPKGEPILPPETYYLNSI